jgi:glycosyltransferase involved in cell wall biosynthesis
MKKVAILVLNNFTNDSRVLKIARSLGANGYEPIVVAMKKGEVIEREDEGVFKVHRVQLSTMFLPRFLNPVKYIEWVWRGARTYRKFEFFHCCDFEALPVGLVARWFNPKLKIVYDAHEYEAERLGLTPFAKKFIKFFEKRWIKRTSAVITVSRGIEKEYERQFSLPVHNVIFNAPAFKKSVEKSHGLRKTFNIRQDQKIFLYSGRIAMGRGVEILIEAFSQRNTDSAVLVFLGSGPLLDKVEKAAAESSNIFYHPPVPYEEVVSTVAQADYGLLSPENLCLNYYYCMPNKLFEYIQAGIPILVADLKDCQELVESESIGFASDDYSVKGWNDLVDRALKSNPEDFSEELRKVAKEFNWEIEEKKLLDLYASAKEQKD